MDEKDENAWLDFINSDDYKDAKANFLAALGTDEDEVSGRLARVEETDLEEIRKKTTAVRIGGYEPEMDAVVYSHVFPPTVVLTVALPVAYAQSLIASWMVYQTGETGAEE